MSEEQAALTIVDARAAAASDVAGAEDQFHTAGVLTISAGHALHDSFTGFLQPLLPTIKEVLTLNNAQAGLLTVFLQWPSLFQPVLGHIADRVSLRPFFIMAPTVTAVAMSLLGVAPSYAVMAMMLIVAGISSASLHVAGPAVIGNLSGKKLGRGMGWWMVGGELGRTLGPLTIVTAVQLLGLRGTPWLMIAGPITSVLLYLQLRNVHEIRPSQEPEPIEWRTLTREIGVFMLPLALILVVRSFINAALATYLPVLLTDQGASLWLAGASLSVYEAAGVFGALLGGTLSDRFGRRIVLFVAMGVTSAAIFLFIFQAYAIWVQFPLLLILGFFSLSITPVFLAMVQENFPENRALATGTYMSLGFLIRSGVVVVLGALADRYGMRMAFIVSGFISLIGIPMIFLLPKGLRREA
jgi:FSR family fosmidomycin resistance protein-like MFS transporter